MPETYDIPSEFSMGFSYHRRGERTPSEGFVQAKDLWGFTLRDFRLRYGNLNEPGARRLMILWKLTYASVLNMSFTPPGESVTTVRFKGRPTIRQLAVDRYEALVTLEEVRKYA